MAKLNTKTSIVDYLKSQGKDSSMSARKEIAKELGIQNYSGTYEQNVQMLKTLKSQASSGSNNKPSTTPSAKPSTTPTTPSTPATKPATPAKGVDESLTNTINSTFTQSDAVTNANTNASNAWNKVEELGNVEDIVSKETWDAINTPFSASSAYQDAWAQTQQMLAQLSSGRTSYTDQIKDMISQIQNREDFQYDVSKDTLFQQSLASAMASGQTAMQDTIGQASALTGGYGSTYATSAGNQAYNAYIQDAYNNLPEYYQMAMEAYQMEGQDMYNQLAMLSDADASEYQRMYDSWNANFTNTQQMYAQEYGAWQDSVSNAFKEAGLQLDEHGQLYNQAYNNYTALQNQANTLYAQEYQKWQDEVSNALTQAGLQNSDYWNQQDQNNFIATNDLNGDGKVDSKDIELQRKWNNEDAYIRNYDTNGDNKVDDKDKTATEIKVDPKIMQGALQAYETEGAEGLDKYLGAYGLSEEEENIVLQYATGYGNAPIGSKIKDGLEDFGNVLKDLFTGGTKQPDTKDPATLPTWEELEKQRKKNNLYQSRLLK